jgi:Asp-tRNA(Asn)/Glu-tRNA(Gln) amidotransferase A subunit family amidase
VATSAAVASVLLAGPDDGTAPASRTLRLPAVEALAGADVRDAFADTVAHLTATGALPPAQEAELPREVLENWFTAFRTVQAWEAWQAHGSWITAHPGALGADVAARFALAAEVTREQAAQAHESLTSARNTLREWLSNAVMVIPSASGPAPSRTASGEQIEAERAATLRMTCLAGLAGAPALSMPLLRSADGLPVGLCLLGAPGTDTGLLTLAAGLEVPA